MRKKIDLKLRIREIYFNQRYEDLLYEEMNDDQIPIGEQWINGQMLHVSGESFVQP